MAIWPLLQNNHQINFMKRIMLLTILLTIALIKPGSTFYMSQAEKIALYEAIHIQVRTKEIKASEFTPDLFFEYINLMGVKSPGIVYSQAILETGWFRSNSFSDYNNLFGMKEPKIRPNLVTGVGLGHASFDHWTTSVEDFKLWQEYWHSKGYDQTDYFAFLDDVGYATASRYVKIVKGIYNKGHGLPLLT